jgi:hypothetical protein
MPTLNFPGVNITTLFPSLGQTHTRGMAVGFRSSYGAFNLSGNWSILTRKVIQSKKSFLRCKVVKQTFYQPTPTPLVDVELSAKNFQFAIEPVAKLATSGLAASPKKMFTFAGSNTAVYAGPGTNYKGYVESDWLYLDTAIAADQSFAIWDLTEDAAQAGASLPNDNSGGSSYINRYEGSIQAATSQMGTLLTVDAITPFASGQGGGSSSSTPAFLIIDYDDSDIVIGIDGDSTGQGVGEGNIGSGTTSDVLGTVKGNTGWIARGVNEKLGLNYALNMAKASDGTKYKALTGSMRLRHSLMRRANPTHIFDGDGINDLTGNGSNRVKTWVVFNATTNYSYNRGDVVVANGNLYVCTKTGSPATTGTGPSGTTPFTEIVDGGNRWVYLLPDTSQGRIAVTAYAGKMIKYDHFRETVPNVKIVSTMVGPVSLSTFPISSLTSSGTTVTATHAATITNGMTVTISGATPTTYNGTYPVTVVDSTHFTYTVATAPASSPATGTINGSDNFQTVANQIPNYTPVTGSRDLLNGLFRRQTNDPVLGVVAFFDIATVVEYNDGSGTPTGKWAVAADKTATTGPGNFYTQDGTHQNSVGHAAIGAAMPTTLFT